MGEILLWWNVYHPILKYNISQRYRILFNILIPFFNKLKDDSEIGPKVFASNLIIKFIYHNPEAVIIIHSPNEEVIQGDREDLKPDVMMGMNADVAHRFWLGKVNLVAAFNERGYKSKRTHT